jgi:hypothetical protein
MSNVVPLRDKGRELIDAQAKAIAALQDAVAAAVATFVFLDEGIGADLDNINREEAVERLQAVRKIAREFAAAAKGKGR